MPRARWHSALALCKMCGSMRALALACLLAVVPLALPRAAAQASADALALSWSAPAGCGDTAQVREAVARRLGDLPSSRSEPLAASGRIEPTASGFALSLRTPTGERRLEAGSCGELIESAAVILALLIDPRAEPEPEPTPEPEPESLDPTASASTIFAGFVRAEAFTDVGLLPGFSLGPSLAFGFTLFRTSLELSGSYLPSHDVELEGSDVGDIHALLARLGVCQTFFAGPTLGACFFVEYNGLSASGAPELAEATDWEPTVWSLLPAARLSVPLGRSFGWVVEVGISLPTSTARFKVGEEPVHETGRVLGRLRTGFELRFP